MTSVCEVLLHHTILGVQSHRMLGLLLAGSGRCFVVALQ